MISLIYSFIRECVFVFANKSLRRRELHHHSLFLIRSLLFSKYRLVFFFYSFFICFDQFFYFFCLFEWESRHMFHISLFFLYLFFIFVLHPNLISSDLNFDFILKNSIAVFWRLFKLVFLRLSFSEYEFLCFIRK